MVFHRTHITLLSAASVALLMAGCSSSDSPDPSLSATLSASKASIARGEKVTLSWSSENADSCAASGDWDGDKGTSGSAEIGPLRKNASYTLTCLGGGNTEVKTVAVETGPVVQPEIYAGFPINLAAFDAKYDDQTTSTSYKGQMARAVLRESIKQTMKAPTTQSYEVIAEVNKYLKNEDDILTTTNAPIVAPVTKGDFIIKETLNTDMGTNKNLYAKMFDDTYGDPIPDVDANLAAETMGVPGGKTAKEVVDLWVGYFGADRAGDVEPDHYDLNNGYDYRQLLEKYLLGAVFYYQSVNKYLDEFLLEPGTKDNDVGYKDGRYYTGKEHSWDEGFGWFGAASNYGELSAQENYEVAKKGKGITQAEALALADVDGDGKVSLYTEYTSGPAYYAASFDKDDKSTYGKDIMDAWLEGRTIIANAVDAEGYARKLTTAERDSLKALAVIIQRNWEAVFAEAVFKYAGESFEEIKKLENGTGDVKDYYGVWSEMKGFMLSLQYGGTGSKINKDKFKEIDDLIGFGPVQPDGNQVNGLEAGENAESYTYSTGNTLAAYKANMQAVQTKLDDFYGLKAKQHDKR